MALESMFRTRGIKPNGGNIEVPETPLQKLEAYKFAYIADLAARRNETNVSKSALELATGDMGLYNPHTLPMVHRSFSNPKAITETAADYSKYFKEAYENASVGDLTSLFDQAGIFRDGPSKIAREKLSKYNEMTLKDIDSSVNDYREILGKEAQKGDEKMDAKAIHSANQGIASAMEAARIIKNLRDKYEMILMETARARSTQEYFDGNSTELVGIISGPDMETFGHHLN